ncbi:hypothetical protein FGO68_gene6518 [Halteria grandinella]|uniref:Uncharacterized protein n=1 Tax=Halteria grandinella TaxID=5974 RepID=A0A8J8T486_HALGN|nr:hypothetical protein FGO68_gene6518 [Halteria grandinella]
MGLRKFRITFDSSKDDFKQSQGLLKILPVDFELNSSLILEISEKAIPIMEEMLTILLVKFPNIESLSIFESSQVENMPDDIGNQLEQVQQPKNIKRLQINNIGQSNKSLYKKLLGKVRLTLKNLIICDDRSSLVRVFKIRRDQAHQNESAPLLLEVIQNSKMIETIKITGKKYPLLPAEIPLLGTFPSLIKLRLDYFHAPSLQQLLKEQFNHSLANLQSLTLLQELPGLEQALEGPHKSLRKVKYSRMINLSEYRYVTLEETVKIVEGKVYGFKFYAPFELPKAFQGNCPHAILIDIKRKLKSFAIPV